MIPVVSVAEMHAIDAAATVSVDVLIDRAARAVAAVACEMLGGTYGRRVTIHAGKGNNGADGRVAARHLERRGVRCEVLDAFATPRHRYEADLVIDAAVGTGLTRPYHAPDIDAPILAVDIPSGFHGDTGQPMGTPVYATRTVTFAALKPGLLLPPARWNTGPVDLADIGLGGWATTHLVETTDAVEWMPPRAPDSHKWKQAVAIVAGSPTMPGAAALAAGAAQRAGAGMVLVATPGVTDGNIPVEAVRLAVDENGWADVLLHRADRMHAIVIGPGLGTSMATRHEIRRVIAEFAGAVVVDADALTALGRDAGTVLASRNHPTVLTPHDGEFERLAGVAPGDDRLAAARRLARESGATVLLKGPTTVIADPDGRTLLSTTGDERLATAGSGDTLSGIIGAFLAAGMTGIEAAAAGAHVHGLCTVELPRHGVIASDLIAVLPIVLDGIVSGDLVSDHVRQIGRFA